MSNFIELTGIECDKNLIVSIKSVVSVADNGDWCALLLRGFSVPIGVKQSYEEIKRLLSNTQSEDCTPWEKAGLVRTKDGGFIAPDAIYHISEKEEKAIAYDNTDSVIYFDCTVEELLASIARARKHNNQ